MPPAGHGRSKVAGARRKTTPRTSLQALGVCGLVALLLAVPMVRAATPNDIQPGQRVDLKVLILSADGTEPGFGAWQAALDREGVPYDTFVAYSGPNKVATLTDDRLADYANGHAKYQAVILASGDLGRNFTNRNDTTSYLSALADAEWAALAKFEQTFGIRRLSDFTAPSADARADRVRRHHPGRAHGHAHRGRQGGVPVPQGPDPDRQRLADRAQRGVRLRGHAGESGGLADARRLAHRPAPPTWASTRTRTTGARRWS